MNITVQERQAVVFVLVVFLILSIAALALGLWPCVAWQWNIATSIILIIALLLNGVWANRKKNKK